MSHAWAAPAGSDVPTRAGQTRVRTLAILGCVLVCFAAIAMQLVRLAWRGSAEVRVALAEPLGQAWSRPDIVDRHGRLIATDIALPSLYADPLLILDADEVAEKLATVLPGLDARELRQSLSDRSRRFLWVARALTPRQAQSVHELGLPGLGFRTQLKRVYPLGPLAGHVIGTVNVDNRGLAGIERMLDETGMVEGVQGTGRTPKPPLRLSLDVGVQHAVGEALQTAMQHYSAAAAAGLVLDVASGEILAAVSLPEVDPARPADWLETARADRLSGGAYELGSVFKAITIAMALESGVADLETVYDVRQPLNAGPYTIKDLHPPGRPLSVRDIFLHSSNVGAGMLAMDVGTDRQRAYLGKFGLLEAMRTEAGAVASPLLPKTWGKSETITIGYGHGLAVAPLQFAAAAAALVNGGQWIAPTFVAPSAGAAPRRIVIAPDTSAKLREIMRLNVTNPAGTGGRAEAEGYRVGGKTGTAEMPGRGGYLEKSVIASFLGAFPMDSPRFLTLVVLFEPHGGEENTAQIVAGVNAAPVTARIVADIAPLLGVLPRLVEPRWAPGGPAVSPHGSAIGRPFETPVGSPFDAPSAAQ
jgi:cell division protein FtsI (penicillin-binding protein 3)